MADPVLAPARVVRQLDGTMWSHVNCAFATAASLALAASGGRVKVTPETMRRRSGRFVANPSVADIKDLGPSNLIDEKVALQHDDTRKEFRAQGLRPPKVRMLHTTRPGIVGSYLAHGATVSIAIGYHVINAKRPASSGSKDFNIVGHDGHAVRLQGLYHLDGTPVGPDEPWDQPNVTDMVDPLADGRRLHGIHVAKGPQRLPLHMRSRPSCAALGPQHRQGRANWQHSWRAPSSVRPMTTVPRHRWTMRQSSPAASEPMRMTRRIHRTPTTSRLRLRPPTTKETIATERCGVAGAAWPALRGRRRGPLNGPTGRRFLARYRPQQCSAQLTRCPGGGTQLDR